MGNSPHLATELFKCSLCILTLALSVKYTLNFGDFIVLKKKRYINNLINKY